MDVVECATLVAVSEDLSYPDAMYHHHAAWCCAQVNVELMNLDESDGRSYSYECRCGQAYVVTAAELREGFDVVGCLGCSLYIRVVGGHLTDTLESKTAETVR